MTARVDVAVDREVDRSVGVGRCRTQIQIVGAERAEPITLQHEGGFAQARGRSERGETAIEVLVDEENEYQIGIEIEHGPRQHGHSRTSIVKTRFISSAHVSRLALADISNLG
jgi:hypothetical protein